MFDTIKLENILFLDLETAPLFPDYQKMPEGLKAHWNRKAEVLKIQTTPEEAFPRSGIYAEFGRIVCISVGFFKITGSERQFRLKSFCGNDEKQILQAFLDMVNTHYNKKESNFCGHNTKEFDYPFLSRRILINGLKLPMLLNIAGKKPWEVCLLDTMDLWKFGDYKSYTSLDLLAEVFGIPSPKDDISGKDICNVFWKENNLFRISEYCQKDVLTVAQIFLKLRGEQPLKTEEIFSAPLEQAI